MSASLCGSSENIISIVNYSFGKSILLASDDSEMMDAADTTKHPSAASGTPGSGDDTDKESQNESQHEDGNGEANDDNDKKEKSSTDKESDSNTDETKQDEDDGKLAPVSDLSDVNRRICVVTTAGLPWRYG
jgi:hypothetical protein